MFQPNSLRRRRSRSGATAHRTRRRGALIYRRYAPVAVCAYTASFNSLAGRNATFLLALILMVSPVAGFRPILAVRFRA